MEYGGEWAQSTALSKQNFIDLQISWPLQFQTFYTFSESLCVAHACFAWLSGALLRNEKLIKSYNLKTATKTNQNYWLYLENLIV